MYMYVYFDDLIIWRNKSYVILLLLLQLYQLLYIQ